jgi:hypothetical protein
MGDDAKIANMICHPVLLLFLSQPKMGQAELHGWLHPNFGFHGLIPTRTTLSELGG